MSDRKNFYFRQRVTEGELDSAFADLEKADRAIMQDQAIIGVAYGLAASEHTPNNTSVDISGPGAAYDQDGQRCQFSATQNCDITNDSGGSPTAVVGAGKEKWVSVFIKFKRLQSDPRIDGYGATVYFVEDEHYEFIIRQGAEVVTPAIDADKPALEADAILLCDVLREFGVTAIVNAKINPTGTSISNRRQDAYHLQATSLALDLHIGTPEAAIQAVLTALQYHITGFTYDHAATDVTYAGGGTWKDGTTNPATTVELQLDKIISDLAALTGAPKIGAAATAGSPTALVDGSVKSQIDALLAAANLRVLKAGDTMSGALLCSALGTDLGDTTNRWQVYGYRSDFQGTSVTYALEAQSPALNQFALRGGGEGAGEGLGIVAGHTEAGPTWYADRMQGSRFVCERGFEVPANYEDLNSAQKRSIAKAWAHVAADATLHTPHFNVLSATLPIPGTGVYEILVDISACSSLDYYATIATLDGGAPGMIVVGPSGVANKFIVRTYNSAGVGTDRDFSFAVFGDGET